MNRTNLVRVFLPSIIIVAFVPITFAAQQTRPNNSPVHVTAAELADHAQSVWNPAYPDAARAKHIEGTVKLRVGINELGNVVRVSIISGDPLLAAAAVSVVKRWNYKPFERQGKRVAVVADVEVSFHPETGLSDYQEWRKHVKSANILRRQGQTLEAEREYKEAIASARKLRDQEVADSLRDLGNFYVRNARYAEALPITRERLEILLKSRVQDPPEIAHARSDLAFLYFVYLNDLDAAEPLLRSAIPVLEKYKQSASLSDTKAQYDRYLSMAFFGLAMVLEKKGRDADAEEFFKRAVVLGKPVLTPDDAALMLRSYAAMLDKDGRTQEASAVKAEAAAIQLDLDPRTPQE